jgi:hypothetical protein
MDIVEQAEQYLQENIPMNFYAMKEALEITLQVELIKLLRGQKCESPQETISRFVT